MWDETKIRVRYAETDKMGIVHHSNYYVWFELGRSEFCRTRGFSYKEMEEKEGALIIVRESQCRHKSPAFYEDVLTIRTKAAKIRSRGVTFTYEIFRAADKQLLATGKTVHIVIDTENKIRTTPENYRKMLATEVYPK